MDILVARIRLYGVIFRRLWSGHVSHWFYVAQLNVTHATAALLVSFRLRSRIVTSTGTSETSAIRYRWIHIQVHAPPTDFERRGRTDGDVFDDEYVLCKFMKPFTRAAQQMLYATTVIVEIYVAVKIITNLHVLFARFVFKHNVNSLHSFFFPRNIFHCRVFDRTAKEKSEFRAWQKLWAVQRKTVR